MWLKVIRSYQMIPLIRCTRAIFFFGIYFILMFFSLSVIVFHFCLMIEKETFTPFCVIVHLTMSILQDCEILIY